MNNNDILSNPAFLQYLNRHFDMTVREATIEELAEFAFGSIEEAIESFNQNISDESNEAV